MQYLLGIIIFLFGVALGSFVCVVANRYGTGLSFLKSRSICFSCNTELKTKDLVPFFSFFFLRGKCRYCESKIPKETFITEILMGVLTVLAAFKSGLFGFDFSWVLATKCLLLISVFGVILLISIYDFKHFIIPDAFLITFFILSLFYLLFFSFSYSTLMLDAGYLLLMSFVSGIVLTIPFLLIFFISKGTWFGFGDVKYIFVLSFLLGFSVGLSAIVLAFWIGAIFAVITMVLKKVFSKINLPLLKNNLTMKSEIPFGPFLSLGIIISFCLSLDLFHIHELFF